MEEYTCCCIEWNSEDYQSELLLRDRLLRAPLGLFLFDEDLSREKFDIHLGIFKNNHLIGTAILTKTSDTSAQLRQVAVDEPVQKQGIGKKLMLFAETSAREHGFSEIWLNARKSAVGFYQKLYYLSVGDEFLELSIPHQKMKKTLE